MSSARIPVCVFILTIITAACVAQDSSSQKSTTPSTSPSSVTENKSASPADRVIIKVGGKQVTQKEFESSIGDIEPKGGDAENGEVEKDRRRLGSDYATVLMLSQIATAKHLDGTPEVRQKLAVSRMQILSDAEFANLLSETKPSPDDLSKYYEAHASEFDKAQIQRLFIWKVGGGSKNNRGLPPEDAKARAAAILQEAASGGNPEKLAEMLNKAGHGLFDSQPLTFIRGQLPASMDKVAFTMKVGGWAEAEDTPDRVILIYLSARDRQSLPEVHSLVEKLVQGEKMDAKLTQLKKQHGIWMDQQYFGSGSAVANDPGEQRPASNPPSKTVKTAKIEERTNEDVRQK